MVSFISASNPVIARLRRRAAVSMTCRGLRWLDAPASAIYGFDRGTPLDRPIIEDFLARHASDIRGRTLEIKDDAYTARYGGSDVDRRDVLDVDTGNARANLIADLNELGSVPRDTYDCIVLTQVLQFLHPEPALANLYQALRPGGTILLTVPLLTPLEPAPPDLWRYTADGLDSTLRAHLPADAVVSTEQHGNAVLAAAFLLGFSVEDLGSSFPSGDDDRCPVVALAHIRRS